MNQRDFTSRRCSGEAEAAGNYSFIFSILDAQQKKTKHAQGSCGSEVDKDLSLSAGRKGAARCGCAPPPPPLALLLLQATEESTLTGIKVPYCGSECLSKEVNSRYLPITLRNRSADGRAFCTGGASLSHHYVVTTNPAATSDSFLFIFHSLSLFIHPILCACLGETISFQQCLSEVPPVLDPHLLLCVFVVRVCMNKQCRVTLCVQR